MRITQFALLLLLQLLACTSYALTVPQDTSLYYYYKGDKIFLERVPDKMLIKFKDGVTGTQAWELLHSVGKFIEPEDVENSLTYSLLVVKSNDLMTQTELDTVIAKIHRNQRVQYASPMLKTVGSSGEQLLAVSDRIVFRLKETYNSLDEIQKIVDLSEVIAWEDGILKNRHIGTLKKGSSMAALKYASKLTVSGVFEYVDPAFIAYGKLTKADLESDQWALNNFGQSGGTLGADINIQGAWPFVTGAGIKVSVVDNGVDLLHPEFSGRLVSGYDSFGSTNGGMENDDSHGTSCAGIIAAADDGNGTVGVAPDAKIVPVRIGRTINSSCTDYEFSSNIGAANAIIHSWYTAQVDVLSNSWSWDLPSSDITGAIVDGSIQGRGGLGALFVFSSGNNNASVSYPANLSQVIAVGASTMCDERKRSSSNQNEVNPGNQSDTAGVSCDGEVWWGSNYGSELDVMA